MLCASPVVLATYNGEPTSCAPCGQCMPCRINRRRLKTTRLLLEAEAHAHSSFCTMTIDDPHLTFVEGADGAPVWTLVKRDATLWVKRVRKLTGPGLRFFLVGEYGNRTGRPHYHALLFGVGATDAAHLCSKTWQQGFIMASEFTPERAAYCAGYMQKKWTKPEVMNGQQQPEFSRGSLRPPLGCGPALDWLSDLHHTRGGSALVAETGDVSRVVRLGGRVWPLDRTIRRRLRDLCGVPQVGSSPGQGFAAPTVDERKAAAAAGRKVERRARRKARREVM